jgi:virulence factor Mce-like protein
MLRKVTDRVGVVGLGAISLAVFVAVSLVFYLGIWANLTRAKGITLYAEFANAPQLQIGDNVKVDGQNVGRVNAITSLPGNRGARVTFDVLTEKSGPIYADAGAGLRWRLLLGGAFYVEVDPGTAGRDTLSDGDTIPMDRTSTQVELEDVGEVFKGGSQRGLQTMPPELAKAFADDRVFADALDTLAAGAPTLDSGLEAVRGQILDQDLQRLVTGAATTVRNLDQPNDDLRKLVSGVGATVETTAARADDLRATFGAAPTTMHELELTLSRLEPTLRGADDLIDRLQDPADDVAPTLAALRPTLSQTSSLLQSARPLLRSLRPAVRALAGTAADGVPLIHELRPSLRRLDEIDIPYMAKKDPETGKSSTVMIGGTAAGFGGSAGQQDENGHFIRFPATGGSKNIYLPCNSTFIDPAAGAALACDSLQTALSEYLKYIPGAPGQGGDGTRKK